VMAVGGIVELILGLRAEQKQLEEIAAPLTAQEAERAPEAEPGADEAAERARRRAERERAGLRRWRPGPGTVSYSPFFGHPAESRPEWLDEEVEIIRRALAEQGTISRGELASRIGARYWGPGRFRAAVRAAVADGVARRVGRNSVAPAGDEAPGAAPTGRPGTPRSA
jgi:hypothetical protein